MAYVKHLRKIFAVSIITLYKRENHKSPIIMFIINRSIISRRFLNLLRYMRYLFIYFIILSWSNIRSVSDSHENESVLKADLYDAKRKIRNDFNNRRVSSFIQIPLDENNSANDNKNSVIFSLKNQIGGLARALQVFQVYRVFLVVVIPPIKLVINVPYIFQVFFYRSTLVY